MTSETSPNAPTRAVRGLVLACFLLSGACGLAYEIVWVRQLTLVAGATTPAVSIVLAVFMGGLALGARLFGGLADRSRNPLRLYAWLELGIALYGLLQPRLLDLAGAGYLAVARQADAQGAVLFAARLAVAAAVLLLPCILMGGTLPVLARFVSGSRERFGLDLGTLYGVNLAGAVAGSVLTGFVLVRELGLHGTIVTAVLGNALVGLASLLASQRLAEVPEGAPPTKPEAPQEALPSRLRVVLLGLAGLSGFATMGYQVTWTRMLAFGFDNTVYGFTIILVIFLLGLSLGSLAFARLDRRFSRVRLLLAANVLAGLTALLLAPQALAFQQHQILKALTARFGMTGAVQVASIGLGAAVVMLLPAVLMGIVFPLVGRLLVDDLRQVGRELGRAYWINTAGAILGSLAMAFVLIPATSLKSCLLALAAAQVGGGLLLLPWCGLARARKAALALAGLALLVAAGLAFEALLPGPAPFDRRDFGPGLQWKLLAHRDDMTASVSVVELNERVRTLRINGFAAATDDESAGYMPMMSHLPMLLHARPRRVLVICFGTGATAGAVLLHPEARVDVVDINRAVLGFAPWFERANHGVFRDPRGRLILDDGRNHLLTTRETYDVITSEPMPPTHAGVVNLYSREYYELARKRLAPGGLLVQWLPFHLLEYQESLDIVRTVQSVFPETTLWLHSMTGLIVARVDGPIRMDWARLQEAWREPALAADLTRLGVREPGAFVRLFAASSPSASQMAERGRLITDDLPRLEFHAPRHMLRKGAGTVPISLAQALTTLYSLRASERLPLDGAPPAELEQLQAARALESAEEQGDLDLRLGRLGEAHLAYQRGLALADTASRAKFLLGLARVARVGGRPEEARRLLAEVLALEPGNVPARAIWRQLGGE